MSYVGTEYSFPQLSRLTEKLHSIRGSKILVTGGGGFFGLHLGHLLHTLGAIVTLTDIRQPVQDVYSGIRFIQGDICDRNFIFQLCQGIDCIFHIASYGMSGNEQLQGKKYIESVNIEGTQTVIDACCYHGVARLVYTSTVNVVFAGQEIINGDESLPILPLDKHKDHYSRTKSVAEQLVIKANGKPFRGDKGFLKTCAIRPPGIYGLGETRHIPRIVHLMESGLMVFKIGGPEILIEWVHVDNLAAAHILAADALTENKDSISAGEVYFISDGKPVNQFDWLRPLYTGLGYAYPIFTLPVWLMYIVGTVVEIVHSIVKPIYNFQPFLTRTELFQVAVTHTLNINKSRQDLGYQPIDHDIADIVKYYRMTGHGRKSSQASYWLVNVALMAIFAILILSFLPVVTT